MNKFLLVDDDPTLISVLERALIRRGFEVTTTTDLTSALQYARKQSFSHALVDLKLGKDSGLRLIRELKDIQPQLAIIMLTGYSSISTAVEAIKAGAINYLCKPVDANEILAAFEQTNNNLHQELNYSPLSVERLEWEHIQKTLQNNQGNISATARSLGMHRRTLQRKLQKRPVKE